MHIEPYKDNIEPGLQPLNVIHSDVSSLYILNCSGTKYYVPFFDDYDKTSEVILLSSKDGVLAAFDLFRKCNQYGENSIRRLRTDGRGEYDSYAIKDYRDKYGIQWEVTVPRNLQMNRVEEHLRQRLYSMASAILNESGLFMKY